MQDHQYEKRILHIEDIFSFLQSSTSPNPKNWEINSQLK